MFLTGGPSVFTLSSRPAHFLPVLHCQWSCPGLLLVSNILSVLSVPASGLQSEDVSQLLHTDPGPAGGDGAAAGRPRRLHSEGDGHRPGDL